MSLADLAAADVANLGLWDNDGAISGTYVPGEQGEDGVGFDCLVRVGTDTNAFIMDQGNDLQNRRIEVLALWEVLHTGIQTVTGLDRDPARGDALRLTARGIAGTWIVTEVTPSHLGGVMLRLRQETIQALAGPGAREIRP